MALADLDDILIKVSVAGIFRLTYTEQMMRAMGRFLPQN